MSRRQVFHWCKQVREARTSSVVVKQSGRPESISTMTINTIGIQTTDDSSLTQCEIAAHLGIAKGTEQKILKIVCCSQSCRGIFFDLCTAGMAYTGTLAV